MQAAERADGQSDFYGIAIRGAPNCGLNFWIVGSTWGPSFGARWYDDDGRPTLATPELIGAVEHYVDLTRRAGPPEEPTMDFMDCMEAYGAGRAAITIEPANEASILYDRGGAVAEGTRTALMPAGPLGTRHVGLYTPPYAIPSRARSKEAAWELAKFLCSPDQVLDDVQTSGFVEVARESVLHDPRFKARFRPELMADGQGHPSVCPRRAAGDELRDGGRQPDRRRDRQGSQRGTGGRGGDAPGREDGGGARRP